MMDVDSNDTIAYLDGTELERIPFGDEQGFRTYEDRIEAFEHEIENGGRGSWSPEETREKLEEFRERWEPAEFNSRSCPACGAAQGEYHGRMCDFEDCPRCGEQLLMCGCETEPQGFFAT